MLPEAVQKILPSFLTGPSAGEQLADVRQRTLAKEAELRRPLTLRERLDVEGLSSPFLGFGAGNIGSRVLPTRMTAPFSAARRAEKAGEVISRQFAEGEKGGGPTAPQVIEEMEKARQVQPRQPLALLDIESEPVKRLAGTVFRSPGAGQRMRTSQKERTTAIDEPTQQTAMGARLSEWIGQKIGVGRVQETAAALSVERAKNARPLWDKAMEGGSIAPLERQFEEAFNQASQAEAAATQRLVQARQKLAPAAGKAVTGYDVYTSSAAARAQRTAQSEVNAAEQALQEARAQKTAITERLRQAQADRTGEVKGGMWSPALQRLLDNPEVKRGLKAGYAIERNKADAANIPFNPHEYAIVGFDEAGEPIVGTVPNMKLIQVAKEGLDAALEHEDMRDKYTGKLTKRGIAVDQLRRSLLAEGDRLNPDWKVAREQWAGDTATIKALSDGEQAITNKWTPAEFVEHWRGLEPSEREFFKIGVQDQLIRDLDFARFGRDATKVVLEHSADRQKLLTMFGSTAELNEFAAFIEREGKIWASARITGGSETALRQATDAQLNGIIDAGHAAARRLAHGNVPGAALSAWQAWRRMGLGRRSPKFNREIERLLTDPDVALGLVTNRLRPGRAPRLQIGDIGPYVTPSVEELFTTLPDVNVTAPAPNQP